jgi:hypothetical protein
LAQRGPIYHLQKAANAKPNKKEGTISTYHDIPREHWDSKIIEFARSRCISIHCRVEGVERTPLGDFVDCRGYYSVVLFRKPKGGGGDKERGRIANISH